ncbi:MAG TPA: asparagine synthase-related protein, partial [Ktedonobacteraceae bacterium]|nr:asparagine synthase-related protein [Ktedonobacteraceae bacterium]
IQFEDEQQRLYYLDLHLRLPDMVNSVQQLATQERMAVRSPYLNSYVMDLLTRLATTMDDESLEARLIAPLVQRYMPNMPKKATTLPLALPSSSLLKPELSDLRQQTLSAEAIRATGIFDPQVVQGLMEQKEASRALLLVFTTQVLCRLFGVEL